MLEMGMIVDLVHSTPEARAEVFAINEARGAKKRPLTFSHVAFCSRFPSPVNPSPAEVERIAACDGVIGTIFMNYWYSGSEEPLFSPFNDQEGVNHIVQMVKDIHAITGNYRNISIGTDFDGFTDPPDDLQDMARMPKLRSALLAAGIDEMDVAAIFGGNALRVLQEGWGPQ
jgi:microsomal dipeptidase-like Zn-dependent dipeptidase